MMSNDKHALQHACFVHAVGSVYGLDEKCSGDRYRIPIIPQNRENFLSSTTVSQYADKHAERIAPCSGYYVIVGTMLGQKSGPLGVFSCDDPLTG